MWLDRNWGLGEESGAVAGKKFVKPAFLILKITRAGFIDKYKLRDFVENSHFK